MRRAWVGWRTLWGRRPEGPWGLALWDWCGVVKVVSACLCQWSLASTLWRNASVLCHNNLR